ncbi:MAG: multiple antibiotic resistance protein, partial [Bacteroidia bacterium]
MDDIFTFALLCVTSFITLVNPLSVMPVFISMTGSLEKSERNKTARKATIVSFSTMVVFAFFGQVLFSIFGISVDGLRVVGSVLFFTIGYDMLQGNKVRTKSQKKDVVMDDDHDVSITPLGIPLICGPGAITNSIVLMEDASSMTKKGVLIGSMLLINLIMFLSLRASSRITIAIGETGIRVMTRLMGLIIMVIGVEFL